jgi:LmbE family N-acetylglucosaminyl deacetylase
MLVSALGCFPKLHMVHVTDGGPAQASEWKGYPTREAYAAERQHEATAALDAAGHVGTRLSYGVADGTAAWRLHEITLRLIALFSAHRISVVFTHAFEGGHPDHDAVAFAVHAAARWVPVPLHIVEFPAYRMEHGALVWQQFVPHDDIEVYTRQLLGPMRRIKERLCAAHASQKEVFQHLSVCQEFFRMAPAYDFSQPANGGQLSRFYAWSGVTADVWRQLAGTALQSV